MAGLSGAFRPILAIGLGMLAVQLHAAAAPDWPARPVRVVAPFAPGGSADTLGRMVAERLSVRFNQNFVVDNRAGAGGTVGSDLVAKSAPDGYTLLVSGIASHAIGPAMATVAFDPVTSFTHIALFGGPPIVVVVHPGVDAKNLNEFVALSKSAPQGISYGSPGPGTNGHLVAELFRMRTGANLVHIPYKGAALAMVDLAGGHIPACFNTLTTAAPHIKSARARPLAHSAAKRLTLFPEVPTFVENGYKDLVATTWFSLSGPAGMPAAIVRRLNAAVREALAAPELRERLIAEGIEPNDLDAEGFTRFVRAEVARWGPVAKAAK
ncbi:MAG TPA: tripartite tricarboxylate transporter substrate binding protein [Burkholderiales bacterium]|nr:tripartite tricarboxylate transporter substrate binding protein [Burkholderiales bacterium]